MTFLFLQPFCKGSITTSKEENTSYIKGTWFFSPSFLLPILKWAHLKRAKAEEEKDLGNHPGNSNYIHRSLWFRALVRCFGLPGRAGVWGSQQWHWSSLVFRSALNWMIDNDWNHTEPEANYRGSGSILHVCFYHSCEAWVVKKRKKEQKFVCHTNIVHGIPARRSAFTPKRAGYHPMRSWANDVARSQNTQSSGRGCYGL